MRAMASLSVNLPHQPVEMVHIPNPTSETFKFDLRKTRYFIKRDFTPGEIGLANWKRWIWRWILEGGITVVCAENSIFRVASLICGNGSDDAFGTGGGCDFVRG